MAEQVDVRGESGRGVLGRTLRLLREKEGKSLGQLADDTGYDKSYRAAWSRASGCPR
jgi:hypothetical protein